MIAAIMPCRGRPEQTVRNVKRLLATAGMEQGPETWQLICMVDRDPAVMGALANADLPIWRMDSARPGYWHALQQATDYWHEFDLIVNLANDLLPGQHWLARAYAAYQATFDQYGLLGFNDGHHETEHSCHFLIDRDLLTYLGGWPVWYDHNFGDTELCARTIELGLYAKAPWATLYHDHPYFGGDNDRVYAEGRAQVERDQRLFNERKARGWPTISR
jgi:GT2 family glycosyltransferase